jgi:hypothetical protein
VDSEGRILKYKEFVHSDKEIRKNLENTNIGELDKQMVSISSQLGAADSCPHDDFGVVIKKEN